MASVFKRKHIKVVNGKVAATAVLGHWDLEFPICFELRIFYTALLPGLFAL